MRGMWQVCPTVSQVPAIPAEFEDYRLGTQHAPCRSMSAKSEQLKARTEAFAIAVVKFCDTMPTSMAGRRIAQQLLDAGTSVAANYRAACRAYTSPLFVSKLAIVDEEADESEFWFRIIRSTSLASGEVVASLEREAHELACIFGASLKTARLNAGRRRTARLNGPT